MKLTARHARSFYKTEEGYLRAIYRKNKDFINSIVDPEGLSKKYGVSVYSAFKARLKDLSKDPYTQKNYMRKNQKKPTYQQLVRRWESSTQVRERADIFKENALSALRKDTKAIELIRKATGWNTKLDSSRISYDKGSRTYSYETDKGIVTFDFTTSPQGVRVLSSASYR